MRLRFMAMPFASARYAASRSSAQLANGSPKSWGSVRLAAPSSPTWSGPYGVGRPSRRRSRSPSSPPSLKRVIHSRTVPSATRSSALIAATRRPWWDSQQVRARPRNRASVVRPCATSRSPCSSSAVIARTANGSDTGRLLRRRPVSYPLQILAGWTT